ncbi:MAG TPA: hypothetical protein VKV38_10415 [Trebonia sp.]|nr:hypothetical protein [Trebonia sp.]
MTLLTSLARVLAAETGRAQPIRAVRHVHLSQRPLVFIPLQLAGEACAPLAAMVGDDPGKPQMLTVYEPRDRTQRFDFAAGLADIVLGYIDGYTTADPAPDEPYPDAPQLLVPNGGGITFTRLLGRSTRFRRTEGEYAVKRTVPLLGRWLSFYAERTEAPASALLLPMTAVLADHWATGQSEAEDANLAALLGWIDPPDGMSGPQAARAAENPVCCPPAGPATDPSFDNEVLSARIGAIRAARAAGDGAALHRAQVAMKAALATQLEPTWKLMWRAVGLLRALPEGDHVSGRWKVDRWAFTSHVRWLRDGGAPQPRRDGAVAAARKLAVLEREAQRLEVQRAYDDPLVMAEYRLTGEAFAGTVTEADPARLDTSGRRAKLRPRIGVETGDEVLAQPGAKLTSPARPNQDALVIEVTRAGGRTRVLLELEKGMGRSLTPAPGSVPAVGERVTYTTLRDDFQQPPVFPAVEDTPWTHGGPPPAYVPADEDAVEEWS